MKIFKTVSFLLVLCVLCTSLFIHDNKVSAEENTLQGSIFLYSGRLDVDNDDFVNLIDSVILYISAIDSLDFVAFVNGANSKDFIGPHQNSIEELQNFHKILSENIILNSNSDSNGLFNSLNSLNNIYPNLSMIKGSKIYLLDSNSFSTQEDLAKIYKSEIYSNLLQNQIEINFINLSNEENISEVVDVITNDSGGKYFNLNDSKSITQFLKNVYSESSFLYKQNSIDENFSSDEVMITELHVLPQTSDFEIGILNNLPSNMTILLKDPLGNNFRISKDKSVENIQFIYTENVKLINIKNPTSGIWNLEISGVNGYLSVLEKFRHKYSLIINSHEIVQINKPSLIVGTIFHDEIQIVNPIDFSETKMFLTVINPEDVEIVLEMLDDGTGRDEAKSDGKYTALLPPFSTPGEYRLSAEMKFSGLNNVIKSQKTIKIAPFPKIDFNKISLPDNFELNQKYKIADVFVNVLGEPYPIAENLLSVNVSSELNVLNNQLDIVPKPVFYGGPAWEYELFFTPKDYGNITFSFTIAMVYYDVSMLFTSDALIFEFSKSTENKNNSESNKTQKINPTNIKSTPIPVDSNSNINISVPQDNTSVSNIKSNQNDLMIYIFIAIFLLIGIYFARRKMLSSPYGFLLDSNDSPIVDFRYVKRNLINRIFFKNVINGKDLNIPSIENIVFKFSKNGVLIYSTNSDAQIRVNNQPIMEKILISENSWIGIGGNLYSFKFNL
ncbi:MAG: hypothetical protein FI687_05955 [SAR202 cluster bacterium]|nr:hypothetical protein [SAR202 cluster bacterium]|tara:strand:- start:53644 stop:55824 length:2181 start_codon:yes stop_codon:yes gene_type:complete